LLIIGNPIPFIPFPLARGRGRGSRRRVKPFLNILNSPLNQVSKRGEAPSLTILPLPLTDYQGKGVRGIGYYIIP